MLLGWIQDSFQQKRCSQHDMLTRVLALVTTMEQKKAPTGARQKSQSLSVAIPGRSRRNTVQEMVNKFNQLATVDPKLSPYGDRTLQRDTSLKKQPSQGASADANREDSKELLKASSSAEDNTISNKVATNKLESVATEKKTEEVTTEAKDEKNENVPDASKGPQASSSSNETPKDDSESNEKTQKEEEVVPKEEDKEEVKETLETRRNSKSDSQSAPNDAKPSDSDSNKEEGAEARRNSKSESQSDANESKPSEKEKVIEEDSQKSATQNTEPMQRSKSYPEETQLIHRSNSDTESNKDNNMKRSSSTPDTPSLIKMKSTTEEKKLEKKEIRVIVEIEDYEELKSARSVLCCLDINKTVNAAIIHITTRSFLNLSHSKSQFRLYSPSLRTHLDSELLLGYYNVPDKDTIILRSTIKKPDTEENLKTPPPSPQLQQQQMYVTPQPKKKTGAVLPAFSRAFAHGGDLISISGTSSSSPSEKEKRSSRRKTMGDVELSKIRTTPSPSSSPANKRHKTPSNSPSPPPPIIKDSLIEGYVMKKNKNRRWKRRWLVLDDQNLYCYKNREDSSTPKVISLFCVSIKPVNHPEHRKFELVTADGTHEFYVESDKELLQWTSLIEDVCHNLVHKSIGSGITKQRPLRFSAQIDTVVLNNSDTEINPIKQEMLEILQREENSFCADCCAAKPEWASLNLGVFLCIECSGAHRSVGSHISKVRSCIWDEWEPAQVESMKSLGNKKANEVWEHLPPSTRPSATDPLNVRVEFIKAKYIRKEFKMPEASVSQNIVFLSWEDDVKWFGFCDVNSSAPLSVLRNQIAIEGIELQHKKYRFLFRKAPATLIQEEKKLIRECLQVIDGNPTIFLRRAETDE